MNPRAIGRLMWKDLYINRWAFGSWLIVGGVGALVNCCSGQGKGLNEHAFVMGMTGAFLAYFCTMLYYPYALVHQEHDRQVLPFVLSLPIGLSDFVYAKFGVGLILYTLQFSLLAVVINRLNTVAEQSPWAFWGALMPVLLGVCLLAAMLSISVSLITRSETWLIMITVILVVGGTCLWAAVPELTTRQFIMAVAEHRKEFWIVLAMIGLGLMGLVSGTAWLFGRGGGARYLA